MCSARLATNLVFCEAEIPQLILPVLVKDLEPLSLVRAVEPGYPKEA